MASKIKIEQPKIPQGLFQANFQDMDENYLNMCIISNCSITEEDIDKICFEQVVFKNVIFIDVTFRNIELIDVTFEKCDLSNTDFSNASIHRVEFKDSKILGLNLPEATLRNVLFDNCHANLSSFGYANLK
ncbi:pentapeptide repeat-containing protein [Virgibacillus necropolis]|uniref:pentapeptide repeat-containing protein n=1 Tax=Virgibacillus necropolis TaxID=163877 RepID=UPI001D04623D|nr:pentapeptide repeat-containing protein [Virgibacillus necropolis]